MQRDGPVPALRGRAAPSSAAGRVDETPPADLLVNLSGTGTPDATGTYYSLASPTRFLDTGTASLLPANTTTTVPITNRAGIPASGVSAVVINLTADKTGGSGYFTAYPSGTTRPKASSLNFPKGWTGANMVTVPVGADGKISLYNANVPARLIVDMAWRQGRQRAGAHGRHRGAVPLDRFR